MVACGETKAPKRCAVGGCGGRIQLGLVSGPAACRRLIANARCVARRAAFVTVVRFN